MTLLEARADAGLLYQRDGHVATITLNRPDAANALDPETMDALARAWDEVARDEEVWVAIITGAGDRFFCAGADLKKTPPPAESFAVGLFQPGGIRLTPPADLWKPTIAAINGMAIGGGLEIALACDLRIASETAQFGLGEVKVASLAGQGGTQRLPRAIPLAVAMKMLLTGQRIDAHEAHRVGLVSDLYPPERLMDGARDLAQVICENAPLSVRAAKMAALQGLNVPLPSGLQLEHQLWGILRDTQDRLEGRRAFAEKRQPEWRGR